LLFQYQSGKEIKTKLTMDLIIFIVGFIIFVVYLIAFLTVIYRQNKIQDQELENDPELDNK
jgi:phosphotransferase system  glucose/maltose/N-acetylglucosamine-specific IIC component|tara:strand:- start:2053 stop:2235 length:183 start_codon:yes stop_codon:yes gene_type:complete